MLYYIITVPRIDSLQRSRNRAMLLLELELWLIVWDLPAMRDVPWLGPKTRARYTRSSISEVSLGIRMPKARARSRILDAWPLLCVALRTHSSDRKLHVSLRNHSKNGQREM